MRLTPTASAIARSAGWLAALWLIMLQAAPADHRSALILGEAPPEVAASFAKFGVPVKVERQPRRKYLLRSVGDFASRTPTNGTAIVYFAGKAVARPGGIALLAPDEKPDGAGVPVADLFAALVAGGGSRSQLVVVDGDEPLDPSGETLPGRCKLLVGGAEVLEKFLAAQPPSRAISPPDKFVLGKVAGDEWVNSRGTVFCWCPPGKYLAGSPPGTPGRFPEEELREVVIKDGFWISKYELTVTENPRSRSHKAPETTHKNQPLTMINHDDAKQMTWRTLSEEGRKTAGLPDDWQYSLPTEEQWEYAARAGTKTLYSFGDRSEAITQYGNFGDKSYYDSKDIFSNSAHRTLDDGFVKFAPAGSFKPNPWGLFDVHGNVSEWCLNGAIRGGSWVSRPGNCRSAYRDYFSSRNEQEFIGYRIVIQRTPPAVKKPKK